MGLSWLQRQQQKLRERKDSMRRAERHPQESRLLSELRSSQQFKGQQQQNQQQSGGRPGDDGYLSDVTLFSELDIVGTSREGSPDIRSLYATPLHINTSGAGAYGQYQQVFHNDIIFSSPFLPPSAGRSMWDEKLNKEKKKEKMENERFTF